MIETQLKPTAPTIHRRPQILGIVNITTDSFSDGGRYLTPAAAIQQAHALAAAGADIIDLGPSSSNPLASIVSAETEIERLTPVIDALHAVPLTLSVDSYYSQTQIFAMHRQVDYLNDIHGFADPNCYASLQENRCQLIIMHAVQSTGIADYPQTRPQEILDYIFRFFENRLNTLTRAGITTDRFILDPGLGFFLSQLPETSLTVLKHLPTIKTRFGMPMLISASRKSFIRHITGKTPSTAGAGTLATEIYAMLQGVDYIRTHDVSALTDAFKIFEHLNAL